KHAEPQKNLYIEMAVVAALGKLRASSDMVEKSLAKLETAAQKPSRRAVRVAAFRSLMALDDARAYETIFKLAQPGGDDEMRTQAIPALGRLGRHASQRDRTRPALTAWLDGPDRSAHEASVAGPGAPGDARAIA